MFIYIVEDKGIELAAMKVELIQDTEEKEKIKNQLGQEIEIQRSNYTQTVEKLNVDIDALKAEILVKNEEISSVENKSSQLGIDYQTKLAESEQNNRMSIDENIVKLQAEINRLNQDLIEKENFVKDAESANQEYENRIAVSIVTCKIYRMRAIINRGLYIFYPILEGHKRFFKELFFVNFFPYVWLVFKSGL